MYLPLSLFVFQRGVRPAMHAGWEMYSDVKKRQAGPQSQSTAREVRGAELRQEQSVALG
jgi:hypothetical protein